MEKGERKLRRIAFFGIAVVVVVAAATGTLFSRKNGGEANNNGENEAGIYVRLGYARLGSISSSVEVSGEITAEKSTALSAKIPGRVIAVPHREGDFVRAGTVVVRQDTSDLNQQVRQAEAGLLAARSRLSQAVTGAGLSDTQTETQIAQAKAALGAAESRLQMLKKGARGQELATAENAVASAKANFDNARVNLERMRGLHAEGALPKQQMDLVQMQYDVASAQYDSAQQQLSLVKAGAREEEIDAAQRQVDQAREALRLAEANRAQKSLRAEDVKSAKAGVAQAEATLAFARQQVVNAHISTPISGVVSKRMTEPGQMANPGVPLIEIVALDTIYFEATVSEMEVQKIQAGQPVEITVDALPGRKFQGKVRKILPTAENRSRQFTVQIDVPNSKGDLKPGMFARGSIEISRRDNAVIIPKDALIQSGNDWIVYVVSGSVARQRMVITGFETRTDMEVVSGLSADDRVVTVGQDKLSDGVKVHVAN
jgi:RND family efflux transporter MFP subunit